MRTGRKGTRLERELMRKFADSGFAVVRSAGSGISRYPCPDILAGNGKRVLAVECKSSGQDAIYIEQEQVSQLNEFSRRLGAISLLAIRFNNMPWFFLKPGQLEKSGTRYKVTKAHAKKGATFEGLAQKG